MWAIQYNARCLGGNNCCHNMSRHTTGLRASADAILPPTCICTATEWASKLSFSDCIATRGKSRRAFSVYHSCLA